MTPTELADLVEKQIALWRRTLSQQPARPATANDIASIMGLRARVCDSVKALDGNMSDITVTHRAPGCDVGTGYRGVDAPYPPGPA